MADSQHGVPLYLGAAGTGALLLYLACLALYRLYLSPISKFPGPRLAALTLWYEFYHDVVRGGQYCFRINELHDQYGAATSFPHFDRALNLQDQSSESILTNFMSAIQTSTMCSIAVQARNVINGGGLSKCSATARQGSEQYLMTFTDSVEVLLTHSSRSKPLQSWSHSSANSLKSCVYDSRDSRKLASLLTRSKRTLH